MTENNLLAIHELLGDFQLSLKHRKLATLLRPHAFFEKFLSWHFLVWENGQKYSLEEDPKLWVNYIALGRLLDSIFIEIIQRVLNNEGGFIFFSLFEDLKKHYERYKSDGKYLKSFFHVFCPEFFSNIDKSKDSYDIWVHYLPLDWIITEQTLKNKESIVARIWLGEFFDWARDRIVTPEKKHDFELDSIVRHLFPSIDPILWSQFLIFMFTPYVEENRMKSILERHWNFGFIGQISLGDYTDRVESSRDNQKIWEDNAISFIYYFNSKILKVFSKDDLLKYKNDLKKLRNVYKENSQQERHRVRLLHLIDRLIKHKV